MNRLEQARKIVEYEARRDAKGNIKLYRLPPGDGGGKWEYAGLNDRYHPMALEEIRDLLNNGEYEKAEEYVTEYIAKYTDPAATLSGIPAIQFALRDICWNRGLGGVRKTLQMALGVTADGIMGPNTRGAMTLQERDPAKLLRSIRPAREHYERTVVKRNESSRFWDGLKNRWDNQLRDSLNVLQKR